MFDANFVHACAGILAVSLPIEVRFRTKAKKAEKDMAAFCEPRYRSGKLNGFVIIVNLDTVMESEYSLADVIAHEICHAAQFTHGIFNDDYHHDEKFQKLCKILEKETAKLGYTLGKLYDNNIDKT